MFAVHMSQVLSNAILLLCFIKCIPYPPPPLLIPQTIPAMVYLEYCYHVMCAIIENVTLHTFPSLSD